jgi:hypothetical protein
MNRGMVKVLGLDRRKQMRLSMKLSSETLARYRRLTVGYRDIWKAMRQGVSMI